MNNLPNLPNLPHLGMYAPLHDMRCTDNNNCQNNIINCCKQSGEPTRYSYTQLSPLKPISEGFMLSKPSSNSYPNTRNSWGGDISLRDDKYPSIVGVL